MPADMGTGAGPVMLTLSLYSDASGLLLIDRLKGWGKGSLVLISKLILINHGLALVFVILSPASRTVLFYETLNQKKLEHPEMKTLFTLDRDPYDLFGSPS